ncbi:hypothetical protein EYF80_055898 [Liparis tanakae]|uniref:Uncharacterized protein n=1 Tax=Liparis tanakae TaxID=230148 RepID=A0A4Z2EYU3_9TELE|nr:hypothetical protein EYF80_055898 [Liparis tanakae]
MSGAGRRVLRDTDYCCSHGHRGSPPFALSLSSFAHQSTCGRLTPALPKTLGLEGRGDRNPSAYYVAFHGGLEGRAVSDADLVTLS